VDNVSPLFNLNQFPLTSGNWWQYQITDFFGGSTDTLILSITSTVNSGDSVIYTCQFFQNGVLADSGHYIKSGSAISYAGNPRYSVFGFFNLKFPLSGTQKWPGTFPYDTLREAGIVASFNALGNIYSPLYTINRVFDDPHYKLEQNIFLTPEVGIVFQSINVQSDTAADLWESIQLMNYHLQ
jgi:hypothetical protein